MEAINARIQIVSEELNAVKGEIINLKAMHAGLHQTSVDAGQSTNRSLAEIANRIEGVEGKLPSISGGTMKKVSLIEPKQIVVEEFTGSVSDSRDKFLE